MIKYLFAFGVATLALTATADAAVIPGDSFEFVLTGFDKTGNDVFLAGQTAVFGQKQTFSGLGPNGQDLTISSLETFDLVAGTTTDSFTLSTPTSFITQPTVPDGDGKFLTITETDFEIGGVNSTLFFNATDDVDFAAPIGKFTTSASYTYAGGIAALPTNFTSNVSLASVARDRRSFSAFVPFDTRFLGSQAIGTPASTFSPRELTIAITYSTVAATVPETPTWTAMILGFGLIGASLRRRKTAVSFAQA